MSIFGTVVLVLGLVILVRGVTTLDAESREALPDEEQAAGAAAGAMLGLTSLGVALLALFFGVPLLVWGLHREQDAVSGKARTRRGGALGAWGASFLLLGALLLALAAVLAGYGRAIASSSGSPYLQEERAEVGMAMAVSGEVGLVGGGLLLALGLTLGAFAFMRASKGPGIAGAAAEVPQGVRMLGVTGAVLVLGLVAFAAFGAGPAATALDRAAADQSYTEHWEGQIGGASTPLGPVGDAEVVHTMQAPYKYAHLAATAVWRPPEDMPPPELVLVLEVEEMDGSWRELGRVQGTQKAEFRSNGPITIEGENVRARLFVADMKPGAARYVLELELE
ncbi:MAG TPA: hypothetical protein VMK65_11760, partial [Longimicrobiales bacterium]|nr:hypothetical protein [Longimicrobiales bacterium]